MSARSDLQDRVVSFLTERAEFFNAPFGILPGMDTLPRGGKVRHVTFGCARTLDATLTIWSPKRLSLHTSRGDWEFSSEQEFYDFCRDELGVDRG